jgi:hypothetical protein
MIGLVDFIAFWSEFERVRCGSANSFLVRSWCGIPVGQERSGSLNRDIALTILERYCDCLPIDPTLAGSAGGVRD